MWIFLPDTFNHLNQSLYVDDFLCGNVSVQAALTTCIESKQILEDAIDEHKESLNTLIASKVLGVGWNEKSDTFYFDSSDLGTFLSKRMNTKRYLLQAAGRLFDPVGFIGPYTIRIKCLIQEIWCLGLDWDDKLPKQVEISWNKWCNEIHYLSEIKIPRYYFQNFLPSNATTIQLYCFSDASKRAYGTVAYLRIELNDGNIISSFVASKGRVAPLKTLSIPRLELMGALIQIPFEKVGLDYAGPIITKPNLKRSRVTLKSHIAIFICFSTKATHLEVVSDLTTEAFLACLRRFIARRSKPSVIWSDNATNFKGARNILNEWNEICKSNRMQLFSAEEGIEWNFIPPASPHFGGLWEANIKSMKRILLRVAKSAIVNFEELTMLMAQIEAVLNSRPLSPLSSDPNDLNPLTPGHFLTNCAISSFPEPYTASDSLSYHSRWKLIQSLRDKFWNRWSTEYLTHLQTRANWSVQNPNLMENQLVLLKDPNTKPLDWPMGRILEVFPGSDGLVRVVNVKTSTGILKRAITKVVPLPIPVDPATVEKNI
ncbi:uncharacterized protein TNCV_4719261 [Trichonephila clavipes]|nr:uncharacterized protein TNCV_4719261 [Trichonephila clavipes]